MSDRDNEIDFETHASIKRQKNAVTFFMGFTNSESHQVTFAGLMGGSV